MPTSKKAVDNINKNSNLQERNQINIKEFIKFGKQKVWKNDDNTILSTKSKNAYKDKGYNNPTYDRALYR